MNLEVTNLRDDGSRLHRVLTMHQPRQCHGHHASALEVETVVHMLYMRTIWEGEFVWSLGSAAEPHSDGASSKCNLVFRDIPEDPTACCPQFFPGICNLFGVQVITRRFFPKDTVGSRRPTNDQSCQMGPPAQCPSEEHIDEIARHVKHQDDVDRWVEILTEARQFKR